MEPDPVNKDTMITDDAGFSAGMEAGERYVLSTPCTRMGIVEGLLPFHGGMPFTETCGGTASLTGVLETARTAARWISRFFCNGPSGLFLPVKAHRAVEGMDGSDAAAVEAGRRRESPLGGDREPLPAAAFRIFAGETREPCLRKAGSRAAMLAEREEG